MIYNIILAEADLYEVVDWLVYFNLQFKYINIRACLMSFSQSKILTFCIQKSFLICVLQGFYCVYADVLLWGPDVG